MKKLIQMWFLSVWSGLGLGYNKVCLSPFAQARSKRNFVTASKMLQNFSLFKSLRVTSAFPGCLKSVLGNAYLKAVEIQ